MKKLRILILDDDKPILESLESLLQKHSHQTKSISNPNMLLEQIEKFKPELLFLDMNYSAGINTGNEGLYWLQESLKKDPNLPVILLTAYGEYELVVKGIKNGAFDFISKPWDNEKILASVQAAMKLRDSLNENKKLKSQNQFLNESVSSEISLQSESPLMQNIYAQVEKLAKTDANVLLLGENGTGKGVLAKLIHQLSKRSTENFVHVDLGSLSENIFESELFGHEKGAFTDAKQEKVGRFEWAERGTLFLDEIGNLPQNLQTKLLSVLQNRELYRLGSHTPIPVDVRLISATNADLEEQVEEGNFRQDLFYRLNTICLELPPLRKRKEDIPRLANHFLQKSALRYAKENMSFNREAMEFLKSYNWPGNIRELENAIEKAVILAESHQLSKADFQLSKKKNPQKQEWPLKFEDIEKNAIIRAIDNNDGKLIDAAKELGLTRQTIYNKCKKYNIQTK